MSVEKIYNLWQDITGDGTKHYTDEVLRVEGMINDLTSEVGEQNHLLADRISDISCCVSMAYEEQGFIAGFNMCKEMFALLA